MRALYRKERARDIAPVLEKPFIRCQTQQFLFVGQADLPGHILGGYNTPERLLLQSYAGETVQVANVQLRCEA